MSHGMDRPRVAKPSCQQRVGWWSGLPRPQQLGSQEHGAGGAWGFTSNLFSSSLAFVYNTSEEFG